MSIIEIPEPNSSITQGDIIKDVTVFSSTLNNGEWASQALKNKVVVVLSRPCVAQNKPTLMVGVVRIEEKSLNAKKLSDAKSKLSDMRDGVGVKNLFYLGQLPGFSGRATLAIEPMFSITDRSPYKEQLKAKRIARITNSFVRELHLRCFYSVAHEGFDDDDWYSNEDLKYLIGVANVEIEQIQIEMKADLAEAESGGAAIKPKTSSKYEDRIEELNTQIADMVGRLDARGVEDGSEVKEAPVPYETAGSTSS